MIDMNIEQIKKNLSKSWQKSMLDIAIIGFFLILFSEMFTFIMYVHYNLIEVGVSKYIFLRMAVPCLLNFLDVVFMLYVYKNTSNEWIQKHKEDLMCYALFFIIFLYITHLFIMKCI